MFSRNCLDISWGFMWVLVGFLGFGGFSWGSFEVSWVHRMFLGFHGALQEKNPSWGFNHSGNVGAFENGASSKMANWERSDLSLYRHWTGGFSYSMGFNGIQWVHFQAGPVVFLEDGHPCANTRECLTTRHQHDPQDPLSHILGNHHTSTRNQGIHMDSSIFMRGTPRNSGFNVQ